MLTLKADVATNYFALRSTDSQIDVQRRSIKSFQQALDLTNSRFQGGISTELDVDQAKATLAAAQSQLAAYQQNRAQLEHAIAVLVGQPPETFSLPYHPLDLTPPEIPPGLPSDLLERPARRRGGGAARGGAERGHRRGYRGLFPGRAVDGRDRVR